MPPFPVRRFTVDEYHLMLESGLFQDRDPYELIHGWIVPKMGTNPPHTFAVGALMELLPVLIAGQGLLRVMQPITTTDSEPEPDVVIASGSKEDYKKRHPKPPEVFLLVEIADTSLREDQTTKLELYAGAKLPVYWIVNLVDRLVEVYTEPRGGKNPAYKKHVDYGPGDAVPVVVAGKELGRIAVKELLP
jgi:hypothetical protein